MVTRMEIEISHGWMNANREIAIKSLHDWHVRVRETGLKPTRIDTSRSGFFTYIAEKENDGN